MALYQQIDYRKALREILDERKRVDASVSFASYAEVIGVQKTFVSKVLGGSAHLSDDQFYLTQEYLRLNKEETGYFRLLYDHSRTGLHSRKKMLMAEIKKVQEEQRQLKVHTLMEMQKPESSEGIGEYYLDPLNLIVHAYLGVDQFAQQPSRIAEELQLTSRQLMAVLEKLKRLRIIDFPQGGGKVKVLKSALHLDVESIYHLPYAQLFRLKCMEQISRLSPERRFVYSVTFSGNHEVKGKLQELYLEFMKKVERLLQNETTHSEVYQMCFDLFPWSKKSIE